MKTIHITYFFLATAHLTVASECKHATKSTSIIIRTTGNNDKDSWITYAREGAIALRITPHNNPDNSRYLECCRNQETGKISKSSSANFYHILCQEWLAQQSKVTTQSHKAVSIRIKKK